MAYDKMFAPGKIAQKNGSKGATLWLYKSEDSIETVLAADYFSNGYDLGMKAGDTVLVIDSSTDTSRLVQVASVTTDGAASLAGGTLELTESGAVPAGVQILELNHDTVVIAATIADAADHQGLFIVKDTSSGGTAAHTLTLTSGTFDGSNNIATLNAPGEELVVWFDGDGNGTIIQNTGSVALS